MKQIFVLIYVIKLLTTINKKNNNFNLNAMLNIRFFDRIYNAIQKC